ncbi:MAG: hypothetical protein JSS09_02525, partial [Verrucomicrobia bacterium]|nr:hypothetical protein [Verrucomicrobiota bacterium]
MNLEKANNALSKDNENNKYHAVSHDDLIMLSKALGYISDENGICFGIAHKGVEAILCDGIEAFDLRLKKAGQLLYDLKNKLSKEDINETDVFEALQTLDSGFHLDLLAFFGGVELLQSGKKYVEWFPKKEASLLYQHETKDYVKIISPLTMPIDLETKGGIVTLDKISGLYSKQELEEFFRDFKETTKLNKPIAFVITSLHHAISVGYDPAKKCWIFVDSNKILLRKIENEQFLSDAILAALTEFNEKMIFINK